MSSPAARRTGRVSIHAPTGGATRTPEFWGRMRLFQFTRPRGARLPRAQLGGHLVEFQFTRPRGARPMATVVACAADGFNSRAHGGRDGSVTSPSSTSARFQFTRPRGARHNPDGSLTNPKHVSIHAPTGGATGLSVGIVLLRRFNSRAHGGRDLGEPPPENEDVVSIHAPTGGATSCVPPACGPRAVFQFTRPRGARRVQDGCTRALRMFQFTRPRGARPPYNREMGMAQVSIHAPTGGATRREGTVQRDHRFNSRAHGGRDSPCSCTNAVRWSFQFTRPRGARRASSRMKQASLWFQFTRPRGARPLNSSSVSNSAMFQFTRPRGARRAVAKSMPTYLCFNSRAHGGRDDLLRLLGAQRNVSIHAPTGGATSTARTSASTDLFQFTRPRGARPIAPIAAPSVKRAFQFTRPRGARLPLHGFVLRDEPVSIHAPTGGATGGGRETPYATGVSIHAPTGGATVADGKLSVASGVSIHAPTGGATNRAALKDYVREFQFTRPRGARHAPAETPAQDAGVSIHAPTGGATAAGG